MNSDFDPRHHYQGNFIVYSRRRTGPGFTDSRRTSISSLGLLIGSTGPRIPPRRPSSIFWLSSMEVTVLWAIHCMSPSRGFLTFAFSANVSNAKWTSNYNIQFKPFSKIPIQSIISEYFSDEFTRTYRLKSIIIISLHQYQYKHWFQLPEIPYPMTNSGPFPFYQMAQGIGKFS